METLSTRYYFANYTLVPTVQPKFSRFGRNDGRTWIILSPYNNYAVDSEGNTIDFYLSQRRNAKAGKSFLKKALASCHATKPRTIMAGGDKAYPVAIRKLKEDKCLPRYTPLCVKKYLNNIIEQDHRFIKKRI